MWRPMLNFSLVDQLSRASTQEQALYRFRLSEACVTVGLGQVLI